MPGVNGHVVGSPAAHVSMSMLSLDPAARMLGWCASTATAGSFCLFCENGPVGLPTVTSESPWARAGAATTRLARTATPAARDLFIRAPLGRYGSRSGSPIPAAASSQASPISDRPKAYLAPPCERRRPVLLAARLAARAAPARLAEGRPGRPRGPSRRGVPGLGHARRGEDDVRAPR